MSQPIFVPYLPDSHSLSDTQDDSEEEGQINERTDWTARLPDELLVAIIDCLPSLRDKLQVESVSHRFQRCLIKLFNIKPLPFELDARKYILYVNGYVTYNWEEMQTAVQMLTHKTKLHSLVFRVDKLHLKIFDLVLSIFIDSNTQCLDKVTSFQSNVIGGNPALLGQVLAKCPELSEFKLDAHVEPEFDLGPALSNKPLALLELVLANFSQAQLIGLLQSIKPNTLKTMRLVCLSMTLDDPDALVRVLGVGAWAALEEIHLEFSLGTVPWMDLFASLPRLPILHKCYIRLFYIQPNQLVAALICLFFSPIEIIVSTAASMSIETKACQYVKMIRQIQTVHPMLEIDFAINPNHTLKLSLGRVSFEERLETPEFWCGDCVDCFSFYPTLITKIILIADAQVDTHLAVGRLDWCRIDSIVADFNKRIARVGGRSYRALAVESDGNLATITFETETQDHQFKITIDCGRCLSNSCVKCVHID